MKKQPVALAIILVILAGAVGVGAYFLANSSGPVGRASAMTRFSSAEEFIEAFKKGRNGRGRYMHEDMAMPMSKSLSADAAGEAEGKSPAHSNTNVQVKGVDEADIVKNDGKYIYAVAGGKVFIVRAYPPREAEVVSKIEVDQEGSISEIFINGDRLAVIGSSSFRGANPEKNSEVLPAGTSFIKVYDISDRESPELTRSVEYEGTYTTARMIEDNIYAVLSTYPYYAYDREDIDESDLIPLYRDVHGGAPAAFSPACGWMDVESVDPERFSSFLTVLAFSIEDDDREVDRRVIAGYTDNAYASLDNLYIASTEYPYVEYAPWQKDVEPATEKTTIYKFKLDGPRTTFIASAEAPGTLLNQFSMDESGGHFRIATTAGHVSREGSSSTNNIYVFDRDMNMAGRLEGLAPGEKIYSVRFMGARAYMVTFKKVDPLFVLDLSDPSDPRVLGELKIPGYSDYLHPYDENHVIGVGKNAVEADPAEGNFAWYQGMKIAIFDVTDVANPKEMHKVEIGDRGTDSYALQDHKAFLFDREKNLLVIPVALAELTAEQKASKETRPNDYGEFTFQGAYVYHISLEGGMKLKGRITHLDEGARQQGRGYYYDYDGSVKRSLYIGDHLYTVSDAKIKVNRLSDLAPEAAVDLK